MVTVTLPNGTRVTYNDGKFLSNNQEYTDIYDKDGGRILAQAPNTALIEFVAPCRIEHPTNQTDKAISELSDSIRILRQNIRDLQRKTNNKRSK